jgi:hypothetical protein
MKNHWAYEVEWERVAIGGLLVVLCAVCLFGVIADLLS